MTLQSGKIDQKEYLKKYLSRGTDEKKKKKKKINTGVKRVTIIDDDIDLKNMRTLNNDELELYQLSEDAPVIAGIVDERPAALQFEDKCKDRRWKIVTGGSDDEIQVTDKNEPKKREVNPRQKESYNRSPARQSNSKEAGFDLSPKRKPRQKNDTDSKMSRSRQNKKSRHSDSDMSPPRKHEKSRHSDSDMSPPRQSKKSRHKEESDSSPPRKNKKSRHSDSDMSPPRKHEKSRHSDSDMSPPRQSKKSRHKDESDSSPLRKNKKSRHSDSDMSPRRSNESSKYKKIQRPDISPPRKSSFKPTTSKYRGSDSDVSPPRKSNKKSTDNTDLSPPRISRKEIHSSNRNKSDRYRNGMSPPKKSRGYSDHSPPRKSKINSDSDLSPPRKSKRNSDSDLSPPRKSKRNSDSDLSPPRISKKMSNKNRGSDSDLSPPRRPGKMAKTLDGKQAGLQDAKELVKENQELRRREDELFNKMKASVSGADASTVVRDRKTGRVRDFEEEAKIARKREEKDSKHQEKYALWGRGVKQNQEFQERIANDLHEMSKPLARYREDEDLEKDLKDRLRAEDPMLQYVMSKKEKAAGETLPKYKGSWPPNRFNIPPGYRWDGVDRSNGYEKQYFTTKSSKKAMEEEAYHWSISDM